jgi:hypothetical protein
MKCRVGMAGGRKGKSGILCVLMYQSDEFRTKKTSRNHHYSTSGRPRESTFASFTCMIAASAAELGPVSGSLRTWAGSRSLFSSLTTSLGSYIFRIDWLWIPHHAGVALPCLILGRRGENPSCADGHRTCAARSLFIPSAPTQTTLSSLTRPSVTYV